MSLAFQKFIERVFRCEEMTHYLHGYDSKEQERLNDQARILEGKVFDGWSFEGYEHILEIGCGVGAQTKILLERNPHIKITAVDVSEAQLIKAKENLKNHPGFERVQFSSNIPSGESVPKFDGAFFCWVLEHVTDPISVLKVTAEALRPGAKIVCTEVFNASLNIYPAKSAVLKYWTAFNELQVDLKGDPNVGMRLAEYLQKSGFKNVHVRPKSTLVDSTKPQMKEAIFDYFHELLLSAQGLLVEHKRVTELQVKQMQSELNELKGNPDSVFFFTFMHAYGEKS